MKVLITGSSQGIGRAIAEKFLAEGHEVLGMDLLPSDLSHPAYRHVIGDVCKPETYPADFEPEILVSNAGVQDSADDIEVNLKGAMRVIEHFAFQANDSGNSFSRISHIPSDSIRSVVIIGSASGHTGSEFPEYAASKAGLLAYTKNVANRLAPQAICNSIDPGGVLTELNRCVMDDPLLWNQIMDLTPLKRWATPEEIAEWVYFVGVVNRFMTGQNLLIDGGEAGDMHFVWPE